MAERNWTYEDLRTGVVLLGCEAVGGGEEELELVRGNG